MRRITFEEDLRELDGLDDLSPTPVHDLLSHAEDDRRKSLLPLLHGGSNIRKAMDVNAVRRRRFRAENGDAVLPGDIRVATVRPTVDDDRLFPLDGNSACHSQILLLLLLMVMTVVMVAVQYNLADPYVASTNLHMHKMRQDIHLSQ